MTTGFKTIDGEPLPSELGSGPGFGPDGKGLLGKVSSGGASQSPMEFKPVELPKQLTDICKSYSGVSSQPIGPNIEPIGGPNSPYCVKNNPSYLNGGTEQFRQPEWDSVHGNHMNYEMKVPGIKKPLINAHISMDDED